MPARQQPDPRRSRPMVVGSVALAVALVAMLILSFLPTGFVVQQPGPVVNTLGDVTISDAEVPVIEVEGEKTYPTGGALSLTTVQVVGNREHTGTWFDLLLAWFDSSKAVLPVDAVFPKGQTTEERDAENQALMVDSQSEATAAALRELGYDVPGIPTIASVVTDAAADGILEAGDELVAVNGTPVKEFTDVQSAVKASEGKPVTFRVLRDGAEKTVEVTPVQGEVNGEQTWLVGVTMMMTFDLPVEVTIQLDKIGGPSAGMMFALGIIDVMTPGELNGGENVAGTGTIDATGAVGPIGGIRQKLYGAARSGATYFLAPATNCDEVVGHVPDGLQVISTATLEESVHALETIASGEGVADLPTCSAAATPTADGGVGISRSA